MVSIILARSIDGVIGVNNEIPWKLPYEQSLFKLLTLGKVVVMGRKTYEEIGKPLVGRTTVVISKTKSFEGCVMCKSLNEAVDRYRNEEIFIAGGKRLYEEAINMADRMYITLVDILYNIEALNNPQYTILDNRFNISNEEFTWYRSFKYNETDSFESYTVYVGDRKEHTKVIKREELEKEKIYSYDRDIEVSKEGIHVIDIAAMDNRLIGYAHNLHMFRRYCEAEKNILIHTANRYKDEIFIKKGDIIRAVDYITSIENTVKGQKATNFKKILIEVDGYRNRHCLFVYITIDEFARLFKYVEEPSYKKPFPITPAIGVMGYNTDGEKSKLREPK